MILKLVLAAWLANGHSVTLNWNWKANSIKATGFSIQRGELGAGPFHQIATVTIAARSYTDTAVRVRGDPYCYRVITLSRKGNSLPSNVACAVIP